MIFTLALFRFPRVDAPEAGCFCASQASNSLRALLCMVLLEGNVSVIGGPVGLKVLAF